MPDPINEILEFAEDAAPENVFDFATYEAVAARLTGHVPGLADQRLENAVLRQLSRFCGGVAQFIAQRSAPGVVDDGDRAKIVEGLASAISAMIAEQAVTISPATAEAAGIVELATPAEVIEGEDAERAVTPAALAAALAGGLAGVARLAVAQAWTKAQHYEPSALTITSGAVTWDIQDHPVAVLVLTSNVTSFTITGANPGATYELTVRQDGTGGRTMSWPAALLWPFKAVLAPSSAANAEDLFHLSARDNGGTTVLRITGGQDMGVAS